jgi:hypothetical protein
MVDHEHSTDKQLANAWIKRFSKERRRIVSLSDADAESAASDRIDIETSWAFDALLHMTLREPERAWDIILLILKLANDDDSVLDNLASGPLETLVRQHSASVIEWVEAEAWRNPQFKELLSGVWSSNISDPLWQRIKRAAGN